MANEDSVITAITTHGVEDPDTGMSARQFGAQIVVDRTGPVFQTELSDIYTSNQPVFPVRQHTAHELLKSLALTTDNDTNLAHYNPDTEAWELTPANPLMRGKQKIIFTTIDRANFVGVPEPAALPCIPKQAGREDLIDQVFVCHKQDAIDSHCNSQSIDDPAYTINFPDPTHQPLLVVNYEELQYCLYPSS
ncbi:hypothetical protein [Endozoicomonas sp. 8E]|uniref:hypothetical protein n=1 Tax=Endozoicomonas sp. 8E TaxID=3035692 RepID=UPI002939410F|nr:hypothetical protein [Endozoicomonas sp. 8E]WOG30113.1 hypothetical protein P6910_10795 [Endozoicomonas sp. 8E]